MKVYSKTQKIQAINLCMNLKKKICMDAILTAGL